MLYQCKHSLGSMEIFSSESDTEDTLNIASKEWNRITDAAKKSGYREGVENGSDSVFQEGFDQGYREGFQTAFILGKFKSLASTMPPDAKHSQDINEILDKTGRGVCNICTTEAQGTDITQKPVSELIKEQRSHSVKVLQTLYEHFQPHANKINITESDILKIQNDVPEDK